MLWFYLGPKPNNSGLIFKNVFYRLLRRDSVQFKHLFIHQPQSRVRLLTVYVFVYKIEISTWLPNQDESEMTFVPIWHGISPKPTTKLRVVTSVPHQSHRSPQQASSQCGPNLAQCSASHWLHTDHQLLLLWQRAASLLACRQVQSKAHLAIKALFNLCQ